MLETVGEQMRKFDDTSLTTEQKDYLEQINFQIEKIFLCSKNGLTPKR
jgi:hypothetical protein